MTAETSNARGEWVLVPRVPTEAMLDAVCSAEGIEPWTDEIMRQTYIAMLAAAPPPAAARGDVRGLVAELVDAAYQDGMQELDAMSNETLIARSALEQALAAEGVQAGEVECDCPGEGKDDPALHAPNCPARLSQQPEARDVVDEDALRDARTIYDIACIRDSRADATREDVEFKAICLRNYNRIAALTGERNG